MIWTMSSSSLPVPTTMPKHEPKPAPTPKHEPGPASRMGSKRKADGGPGPEKRSGRSPLPRVAYHHGALREALIDASESLLAERGIEGFSLREVARRSGVSPAAPAHHFGDTAGLLSAVATQAFDGLTAALEAGNLRGGDDPVARLREQGVGYVEFALRHPGRFGLMFRVGPHKSDELKRSADAAFGTLEQAVRNLCGVSQASALQPRQWNALLSIWSMVHGFAHLALAGQFDHFAPGGALGALVRAALAPMLEQHLATMAKGAAGRAPRPSQSPLKKGS
jgi:AcrR family transcriptional regulator